jgi:hypothetical protein
MITLPNKDREIFDLPLRILDIVKEYQETGEVVIDTNHEGINLQTANFYKTLDYACEKFNIKKSCITIVTTNVEESHEAYNIKIVGNHWVDLSKKQFDKALPEKNIKYNVGCFLGKPNWHRLVLAAWLHNNYKAQTLLTCHYDPMSERHKIDSELTNVNVECSQELISVVKFIDHCPITLSEGFIDYTIGPDKHYNIIKEYDKIFVDLVVETYVSGASFFPTEKTLRPIIAKTPFVIMGSRGYLENLRRIGFKTFSKWWDESYDDYSGYSRIVEIRKVLTKIFELDTNTINEMQEVLNYNYSHLKSLTPGSVKLNGK